MSRSELTELLSHERLVLSLVGMSNIGKTYWARKLSQIGFHHVNCDDLIEQRLTAELESGGHSGIEGLAEWMGQPTDTRYQRNQDRYLSTERDVLFESLSGMVTNPRNVVLDTTGSVVHAGADACELLEAQTLVVYLAPGRIAPDEMFQSYLAKPKPLVFGELLPADPPSTREGLGDLYKALLQFREDRYQEYANVTLARSVMSEELSPSGLLDLIAETL